MGQIDKWFLKLEKERDAMEGQQKIPKGAVKNP